MNFQVRNSGEYSDIICRYFQQSFPKSFKITNDNLLEILTTILIGTKDFRYGPIPTIESQFTIRQTIANSIESNIPIPMLFPWGGRKIDPKITIDVAEVSAIKQIITLDENVKKFYQPGIIANIRIEDVNAKWLYKSDEGVEEYSSAMMNLIDILANDTYIKGVRESELMYEKSYFEVAERYSNLLYEVLTLQMFDEDWKSTNSWKVLTHSGWTGEIPREQREYYIDRYKKIDPDGDSIRKLADYFGGSKARYDLNGKANPVTPVGSFIQGNFAHPVPGAPKSLFNNTLYYRTIPEMYGRTHIAPWRSKGYLQIIGTQIIPKIIYPGTDMYLVENSVEISSVGNTINIPVRADYSVLDPLPHGLAI